MTNLELLDKDGENLAVRMFLAVYSGSQRVTVDLMRNHLKNCGFDGFWPEWANDEDGHLTKGGAQDWLRYLFFLEVNPPASVYNQRDPVNEFIAKQEPLGFHIPNNLLWDAYVAGKEHRKWVNLTDEEIMNAAEIRGGVNFAFARSIEAKLKEKNHG